VHVKTLQRHRSQRIPWGFKDRLRRNNVIESAGEDSNLWISKRRNKQRSRPLRTWNSSKAGKKECKLRREHNNHQIGRKGRSRPLVFTSREQQEERKHRKK
jgi:hypothetical protein